MRILVLAGESPDLGPHATLRGLCRALHASVPGLEVRTSLANQAASTDGGDGDGDGDGGDPPLPVLGLRAARAAARRSDLVLLTHDAFAASAWRTATLLQILARTGAPLAGVSFAPEAVRSHAARWLTTHALRKLGLVTAADESAARRLQALPVAADVLPDPALLVVPALADAARTVLAAAGAPCDGTPLIGVVPRRFELREEAADASDARLVELLARTLDAAIERHGAFVVCLPARASDAPLADSLAGALRSNRVCVTSLLDPTTFKGVACELTMLLSSHRRAALLAAAVGRPTVGLGVAASLGPSLQSVGAQHACLDASLFLRGGLVGQLGELIDAALELRRTPLVRFEELKARARAGIRELIETAGR